MKCERYGKMTAQNMTKSISKLKDTAQNHKPMTLSELKERLDAISRFGKGDIYKSRTDQIIQTFTQFCKENHIVQVVEGELPELKGLTGSVSLEEKTGFLLGVEDCKERMLKWHKQSLKPVSEVLR